MKMLIIQIMILYQPREIGEQVKGDQKGLLRVLLLRIHSRAQLIVLALKM